MLSSEAGGRGAAKGSETGDGVGPEVDGVDSGVVYGGLEPKPRCVQVPKVRKRTVTSGSNSRRISLSTAQTTFVFVLPLPCVVQAADWIRSKHAQARNGELVEHFSEARIQAARSYAFGRWPAG